MEIEIERENGEREMNIRLTPPASCHTLLPLHVHMHFQR